MHHNNVVIVTGSGGVGCGRAVARRFAASGAAVVVSDIDRAGGLESLALITAEGGRAAFCPADVREDHEARDLVTFAERTFGGVSVVVNNASSPEPSADGLEGWTETLRTDLFGTLSTTRWAMESMRRSGGGTVVNIASISALWHGRTTPGGFPGYDAAKAGVIRLTTGLAALAARDHIRVNCLAPGWIATGGALQYWQSLTPAERAARGVPARLLAPDDVAEMVLRLASDQVLNGRIVVWWSDKSPRLLAWGDRGYADFTEFARQTTAPDLAPHIPRGLNRD